MPQKYSKPNYFNTLLTDFIAIIYPEICIGCRNALKQSEHMLCLPCAIDMPKTNYANHPNNSLEKLFWYKTKIEQAASIYFFSKKSRIQHMIHEFKYRGNQDAAIFLGEKMGHALLESSRFKDIDCIIPVPLHIKKLRIRGYNQAELLAIGMSNILKIPVVTNVLIRDTHNATQTNKGLFNRWSNVKTIFKIKQPKKIENNHILLVDDVITSGSTIEACANQILMTPYTKVSIVSLAIATG